MRLNEDTKVIDNKIYIGDYSLTYLKNKYQTPLYIYGEKELKKNINIFNSCFKGNYIPQIVYASKALLIPKMCEYVKNNNWMIDAVSLGDLKIIKKYLNLKYVVFHGNNKSKEELTYAVKNHVGIIVIDNFEELKQLYSLFKDTKYQIKTMFRINPHVEAHTHKYIQTSLYDSKFGESIENLELIDQIINFYKQTKNIKLIGFHSHIGSQINEITPFVENAKKMIEFTNNINEKYNLNLTSLNLGGGFGVNYTEEDPNLSAILLEFSKELDNLLKESLITKIYIEPGRSIVAESGMTLYTASYTKTMHISKKNYLMVDGGMTDNIRPALYDAKYTVLNGNKYNSFLDNIKCDVVGKCCESGDIISKDTPINAEYDDPILVLSTGAYGYSMKSNYNNSISAPIILINDKKIEVLSKRQKYKQLKELFK